MYSGLKAQNPRLKNWEKTRGKTENGAKKIPFLPFRPPKHGEENVQKREKTYLKSVKSSMQDEEEQLPHELPAWRVRVV